MKVWRWIPVSVAQPFSALHSPQFCEFLLKGHRSLKAEVAASPALVHLGDGLDMPAPPG